MEILNKKAFYRRKEEMVEEIRKGKMFVYPTDTIYGIGCNALMKSSIKRIRTIKRRSEKPFSIIAPSVEWIEQNCLIDDNAKKWITKLPGKITLILPVKNRQCVSREVNGGSRTLGVRIPNNWFARITYEASVPFVTTSVNITGKKPMTSLKDIDDGIKDKVDYIINQGILNRKPSRVISLLGKRKILR